MTLWTSTEAAAATGGTAGKWQVTGISIDTRTLQGGDLFIALKGPNSDGHDYINVALQRGAAAVMVDHIPNGIDPAKCLIVADTLIGLQDLGHAARARTKAKIIAVTGSVGKTGTKDMLAVALAGQGSLHASQKSYNNHWGVPLTLALMPRDCEICILEMGMNHSGELSPLSSLSRPDIAVITTVEAVHIENFETGEQGIATAKAEIFDGMRDGMAILNQDNKWFSYLYDLATKKEINVVPFGAMFDLKITPDITSFTTLIGDENVSLSLSASGAHHASNACAVLSAVHVLGYDVNRAARALEGWQPRDGRGKSEEIMRVDGLLSFILIDESYNASPVAMRAAFAALSRLSPAGEGRRIVVLGDMAELGDEAQAYHVDLVKDIVAAGVNKVYAAGIMMKHLYDALPPALQAQYADTPPELCEDLVQNLCHGDVILVKGSRGSAEKPKMQVIIDALKALR